MKCNKLEARTIYVDCLGRTIVYFDPYEVNEYIKEFKARIAQLEDDNALLRKNNAELRENQRWRNCSEQLPAIGASVLISDGFVRKVAALMYDYTWNVDEAFYDVDDYKFWMPLPETPEN